MSSPTTTSVAANLYSLAQLNGSAQEAPAPAAADPPRTRITESVASNDSNTTLPNGGDADTMDPIERQNLVIAALRVPSYVPNAAIDYANDLQSQRNEGKNIAAFAKIAARDWCFFVQDTQVRIGRVDSRERNNQQGSQPDIAGLPTSEPHRQDWGVHIDLGPERQISRVHAEINFEIDDQQWYITVNSRNGLKLDDRHLTRGDKAPLHSGICISIMSTQMLFLLANQEDHFHPMLWRQVKSEDAAESDNDTEEHVPKLVQESSTAHQSTDSLLERSSSVKAASATASSHVYDDVSMTDVDNEALLLSFAKEAALAAAPVELPVTAFKDQKPNKAKEKDAKASDLLKEVAMVDLEVPQKQLKLDTARTATGIADPTTLADDGYVTALLKMPNGPGVTRKSRNLHEKQVAMHITPFALPVTAPKQDKTLKANQKVVKVGGKKIVSCETDDSDFVASLLSKPNGPGERKKAHDLHNHLVQMHVPPHKLPFSAHGQKKTKRTKSVDTPVAKFIHGPVAVDASADDTELIVGDYASNVANLKAENSIHDKGTLIGSVSQINPFPINKA